MDQSAAQFLSGALAGVVALLALHWLDSIKLLQQHGHRVSWVQIAQNPARLYSGVGPALLETAVYNALQFGFYDRFKQQWEMHYHFSPTEVLPPVSAMLVGLAAGCVTQCCTSPLKVVAMRLTAGRTGETSGFEAAQNVWREGGLPAFFSGNLSGLVSQPLGIALSFSFFELLRPAAETLFGSSVLVSVCTYSVANCISIVIIYPLRMGKDKLQSQKDGEHSGLLDVWTTTYRERGINGLYSGLGADLTSAFIKRGITFWCKEAVLATLLDNDMGGFAIGAVGSSAERDL